MILYKDNIILPEILPDPQNNNKKCDDIWKDSPNRVFEIRGNDAQEEKCKQECQKDKDCLTFSGIWNQFCIGCKIELSVVHKDGIPKKVVPTVAFRKRGSDRNSVFT